jgi:hypothetical protein
MKRISGAAALVALWLAPTAALADYWVYCIHNKIKIESRAPKDVERQYTTGSICTFGQFNHAGDAQRFSTKNFGGAEGHKCACR